MALNLPFGIRPIVALSNVDERYGPHASKAAALIATAGTRKVGLTVGILENSEIVEYWFKSGITDLHLIAKFPTTEVIDTSTAEVWDTLLSYEAGNVYVSYVNTDSEIELFQSEALYRCRLATNAGESPEDSLYDSVSNPTAKWIYQGTKVVVSTSSTATSVVKDINTLKGIIGYKEGHTVSVIDTNWTYKFTPLDNTGETPNDIEGKDLGSWTQFVRFNPGHVIQDTVSTFDDKLNLKFTGNVKVSNLTDTTVVNIGWNIININSLPDNSIQSFNANPNTIYIIDATYNPIIAILPNATLTNTSDQFRFILKADPHKLTITTLSGVQLIEGYTSQNIPTVSGSLLLMSNGTGYNIIEDNRQLTNIVEVTTNRDFGTDGFENNVIYYIKPNGGEITITLPEPVMLPGNTPIKARFEQSGSGRSIIHATNGTIAGVVDQIITSDSQGFDIIWKGTDYFIQLDTRPKILTTSYTSYPTKVDSDIIDPLTSTFFKKRVSTVEDLAFDVTTETFTNYTITANPSDSYQLLASSSITVAGALVGIVPEGSLTIYWNIYIIGNTNLNVYAKYFKRSDLGVETLIATSAIGYVDSHIVRQYILSTTHSEFIMNSDDTIVVRYYARKNTTGGDSVLYLGVEGPNPTKSIFEVAVGSITHNQIPGRNIYGAHDASDIEYSNGESVEVKLSKLYTESTAKPILPNKGDKWLNTTTGILYEWFSNGITGTWVCWTKL